METRAARRLEPDNVVASALAIAEAEGLEAVTVRRLADQHGVTPMALYRHFRDKEKLLDAMADHVLTSVRIPTPDTSPWDVQLHALLAEIGIALRSHPRVAPLTLSRFLQSEPGLILAERTLSLLAAGGFTPDRAAELGTQAICALITFVATEPGMREGPDPDIQEEKIRLKRAQLTALPPTKFPHVLASADALLLCPDPDAYYARGVELMVAGIKGVKPE